MKRRLYCIFSKEAVAKMKGNRGKLAAQAGHAFLHAYWDAEARFCGPTEHYRASPHAFKIVLIVDTDAELVALRDAYQDQCGVSLTTDAGFTVFDEPTITCLGIGPIEEDAVGDDLKGLKLFL